MRSSIVALAGFALALVVSAAAPAHAQTAEELVPFEKLDVPLREELWRICQRYTVRRKVPERTVACTLDTYEWLLRRLPIASAAAQKMGLGRYVIEDRPAAISSETAGAERRSFSIDDTDGAFARCEVVHEERGRLVIVARGTVEGTLLPRTGGTGVIIVRYHEDPNVARRVLTDCHVFFRVTNDALHRVTAPFRDALGKILGSKLDGLVGCATKVSEETQRDPARVLSALEAAERAPATAAADFRKKFLLD